mmetsp:Transcript_35065/g.102789  ORF Transcript_35065/g.102789 Transcript_35065/m.102789 type:complete len:153 (+) Transcript_35065:71-529(+)
MSKNEIKDLKIKTSSCARTIKDLEYSKKEIAKQVDRIQQYTDDPERDIHDVKKQVRSPRQLDGWLRAPCLPGILPLVAEPRPVDARAQEEVLAEMHAGVPTEIDQLDKYLNLLQDIIEQYADNADIKATEEYSKAIEVERQAAKVLEEYRPS